MNVMTIAIGASVICLVLVGIGMITISNKKRAEEKEKIAREAAYKKAMEASKAKEHQERVYKAETGHIPTQLFLAKEAELGNPREALHWYERAANADNEIAMYSVVRLCNRFSDNHMMNLKGKYWNKVIEARGGNKQAQFEVGLCLLKGHGIDQDMQKGIDLIEEVAEEGNIDAQLYMSDWHVAESNPNPDATLAAEWSYRAAQQGSTEGMIRLGRHYAEGQGVEQNQTRATYWLERAAETGSGRAQYFAGELWADTDSRGNALAYIWFFLSAHSGFAKAKKRRDEIGNAIGIDAIVGLQGLTKPIQARMDEGKIKKHSIIKALNKMYKREEYFPEIHGDEFVVRTLENTEETKPASPDYTQAMT
ncbi:sel1 repeat family protein [Vibrio sp. SCSIO 43132]|uniref:tetratricopeptide repeat protein n=1 Tax=Vibrio sp. SCSIO 43132 TaxID=2779363 RepID=UPI001CA9A870|nr:tetratricopeptide repeat protein [Vibrio sp. SCSIO 43132]UAB72786.1 sel1 repeat family protein [Vibrio sp. SCSIO 43132]